MYACLLLLTLAVSPSAPQQQTRTAEQRIVALAEWLGEWKTRSLDVQDLIKRNQIHLATGLDNLGDEAVEVKAQNEQLLVDFADLVKTVQLTQNVTSQLLIDLQVLKGRQAVAGAIQGAQVFMFLAYLVTIAVCYFVKHCRKHQEEVAKADFELLETKLQASRSRRRAAAAARTGKQTPQ